MYGEQQMISNVVLSYFVRSVLVYGRSAVTREIRRVQRTNRGTGGKVQNGRGALQEIVGNVRAPWVTGWRSPAQLASIPVFYPGVFDHTNRHDSVPVSANE